MGDLILAMNGAEHRTYRNLVAKAFRASQLERWDETLVRPTIDRLLDAIAPLGRADLVASVTSVYPVQVICGIAGVPLEDAAQFAQWAEQINMGPLCARAGHGRVAGDGRLPPPARGGAARASPPATSSPISCTKRSTASSSPTRKIYGFLRLLLPAGAETTFRVMGNCLYALLSHPDDARARVRRSRAAPRGDRGDVAVGDVGDAGESGRDA